MSKGSAPRPLSIPPDEYAQRFARIFPDAERPASQRALQDLQPIPTPAPHESHEA